MRLLRIRQGDSSSKLRLVGVSRSTVLWGAMLPMAIAVAIGVALAWGADRTLGVAGTVFAIATFALSQFATQGPRTRSVVMIPKSRSPFSASIHRGLSDTLATEAAITFTVEWPKANEMSEVEWQVSVLRSESCRAADGLVIIPAGDDESLWEELVQLTRSGVFIVVVDTKPMNSFFSLRRASRPNFVGSNFSSGGTLVGKELVMLLGEHKSSVAVVAGGPPAVGLGSSVREQSITPSCAPVLALELGTSSLTVGTGQRERPHGEGDHRYGR